MTTIAQLQQAIEALQAEIEADKKRLIEPKEKRLEELKDQLLDVKLEAFFQLFPEKRLANDDPILVTQEFNQLMERRGSWGAPLEYEGKILWIYSLESVRIYSGAGSVTIPFDVALRMRQAWLREHGQ